MKLQATWKASGRKQTRLRHPLLILVPSIAAKDVFSLSLAKEKEVWTLDLHILLSWIV